VNENLCRVNRKWCQYDCTSSQQVLKKVHDPTKLGVRTTGPYTIDCVHVNGNVSIILHPSVLNVSTYKGSFHIIDMLSVCPC
jgi:hypothetical protein